MSNEATNEPERSQVTARTIDGITYLTATGEIDFGNVDRLRGCLDTVFDSGSATIVIDAAQVTFLDSMGVDVLVRAHQRATAANGALRLVNCQPIVQRILDVVGVSTLLTDGSQTRLAQYRRSAGPSQPTRCRACRPGGRERHRHRCASVWSHGDGVGRRDACRSGAPRGTPRRRHPNRSTGVCIRAGQPDRAQRVRDDARRLRRRSRSVSERPIQPKQASDQPTCGTA